MEEFHQNVGLRMELEQLFIDVLVSQMQMTTLKPYMGPQAQP